MLRDNAKMQSRSDRWRDKFSDVLFPLGRDPPSLHAVPARFRGGISCCVVAPSCITGEDGLFVTANLPVGTTWLMGGSFDATSAELRIYWEEHGLFIGPTRETLTAFHGEPMPALDDGLVAWKANEPPHDEAPNAVFFSSPEGVYLSLCSDIHASPTAPKEIFVYYGDEYPRRGYTVTRYSGPMGKANAANDLDLETEALKVLRSVHGIRDRRLFTPSPP